MRIVAVPSWACPNRCHYCDYLCESSRPHYILHAFGRVFSGREATPGEWADALGRTGAGVLEFSGGEPILYSGWGALTAWLARSAWTWALTSSLCSRPAVEATDWGACKVVTASYHYRDWEGFISNLRFVRERVADIRCTLVATPGNIESRVLPAMEKLKAEGVQVNIHPLLKMRHTWDVDDWAKVQALDANVVRDIPPTWPESRTFPTCNAGADYCFVDADLSVYRCYSQWLEQKPIGRLGDKLPPLRGAPCGAPCIFPCDVEIAKASQCSRSR